MARRRADSSAVGVLSVDSSSRSSSISSDIYQQSEVEFAIHTCTISRQTGFRIAMEELGELSRLKRTASIRSERILARNNRAVSLVNSSIDDKDSEKAIFWFMSDQIEKMYDNNLVWEKKNFWMDNAENVKRICAAATEILNQESRLLRLSGPVPLLTFFFFIWLFSTDLHHGRSPRESSGAKICQTTTMTLHSGPHRFFKEFLEARTRSFNHVNLASTHTTKKGSAPQISSSWAIMWTACGIRWRYLFFDNILHFHLQGHHVSVLPQDSVSTGCISPERWPPFALGVNF